ncbi:MAG: AEC family transporter, partial [Candidatus Hydrogenedentota bacterium]
MSTIFAVLSAVLPVFLVAGAAYTVRRAIPLHVKTLSTLNLYLLIPCLVFSGLSRRVIEWGLFARYAGAVLAVTVLMLTLLYSVARLRKLEGPQQSAFLLTQFPNLGNFGLPLVLFAFGQETLPLGILVLVCGSFLQ